MQTVWNKGAGTRVVVAYWLRVGTTILTLTLVTMLATVGTASEPKPDKEARMDATKYLIGKNVFACQTAELYEFRPNSPVGLPIGDKVPFFPLLAPLEVVDVVPSVSSNLVQALLVIVKAPNREEFAFKGYLPMTGPLLKGDGLLEELVGGEYGGLMLRIPKSYSADQVESIQYHVVSNGMTEDEVTCALGLPDSTNDYGQAGKQLVYLGGRELIYVDSNTDEVTDIQHLEP